MRYLPPSAVRSAPPCGMPQAISSSRPPCGIAPPAPSVPSISILPSILPLPCGTQPYVGNPGFGIHCHPLDSVNPGFLWRAPLVNPLDFVGFRYRDS